MPLYAFGANGLGQLGIGTSEDHSTPQVVQLPPDFSTPPVGLVGGGNHLLILDSLKNVFGCGNNKALNTTILGPSVCNLTKLTHLNNVTSLGCGFSHSAALSGNSVCTFGEDTFNQLANTPSETPGVPTDTSQYKYVTCGPMCTLAVKNDGTLWGWGVLKGVLKTGKNCEPYQIKGFPPIKKVLAGFYHILALTEDGHLYTHGQNRYGQRGVLEFNEFKPSLVNFQENVVDIQVGWHTCLVLTDLGNVWGWGRNDHFQLGMPGLVLTPSQLSLKNIVQIASGSEHSLALSKEGQVFLWGWNEHGNCGPAKEAGQKSNPDVQTPTLLPLPNLEKSISIGAGYGFSLIWCEESYSFTNL